MVGVVVYSCCWLVGWFVVVAIVVIVFFCVCFCCGCGWRLAVVAVVGVGVGAVGFVVVVVAESFLQLLWMTLMSLPWLLSFVVLSWLTLTLLHGVVIAVVCCLLVACPGVCAPPAPHLRSAVARVDPV